MLHRVLWARPDLHGEVQLRERLPDSPAERARLELVQDDGLLGHGACGSRDARLVNLGAEWQARDGREAAGGDLERAVSRRRRVAAPEHLQERAEE